MTPIEQIREAGNAMRDALQTELSDLEVGDAEIGPQVYADEEAANRIRNAMGYWDALFPLLSSMEGQTKPEPVGLTPEQAYRCWADSEYKWPSLPTPRIPWAEFFLQTLRERAVTPSPSAPCISVEDAMEAYQNHMLAFGLHVGMKTDRAADLRERLIKAAK